MDDLVKAVQALKLAFERRNLPPPEISVSPAALASLKREAEPFILAHPLAQDQAEKSTELCGVRIFSFDASQASIGIDQGPMAMTCAGNYRETSYRDGLPISRLFGGGLFGG